MEQDKRVLEAMEYVELVKNYQPGTMPFTATAPVFFQNRNGCTPIVSASGFTEADALKAIENILASYLPR